MGGGGTHMSPLTFCKKFNAHKFFFERFFDIMRIFGSIPPESESTFPFQFNIIFETYQFLEIHSSSPGGDRQMRLLTFVRNSILNDFYLNNFLI